MLVIIFNINKKKTTVNIEIFHQNRHTNYNIHKQLDILGNSYVKDTSLQIYIINLNYIKYKLSIQIYSFYPSILQTFLEELEKGQKLYKDLD